ncbi:hypothetical protein H920_02451 [Fukomys damarensis]|uniref:Uncharacterized protein n=1 Tax=Fukomys damarensis TaxID=885580 RepID=A0A091DYA6_FUKDA|nr:hypothetical protein H920_02451 [Fukomys damarensis]
MEDRYGSDRDLLSVILWTSDEVFTEEDAVLGRADPTWRRDEIPPDEISVSTEPNSTSVSCLVRTDFTGAFNPELFSPS